MQYLKLKECQNCENLDEDVDADPCRECDPLEIIGASYHTPIEEEIEC